MTIQGVANTWKFSRYKSEGRIKFSINYSALFPFEPMSQGRFQGKGQDRRRLRKKLIENYSSVKLGILNCEGLKTSSLAGYTGMFFLG